MDRSKVARGQWGERLVARHYQRAGYAVLERNWHGPEGELDLVVGRGGELVFCEVKTRASPRFGVPAEAVTAAKQRRVRVTAMQWLRQAGRRGRTIRFDVASVIGRDVEIYVDAF